MPEISGRILDVVTGQCIWCGRVARETGYAPGLGTEVPLHPTCAMSIIYAYRRWITGRPMTHPWIEERARRLYGPRPVPLLSSGSPREVSP